MVSFIYLRSYATAAKKDNIDLCSNVDDVDDHESFNHHRTTANHDDSMLMDKHNKIKNNHSSSYKRVKYPSVCKHFIFTLYSHHNHCILL